MKYTLLILVSALLILSSCNRPSSVDENDIVVETLKYANYGECANVTGPGLYGVLAFEVKNSGETSCRINNILIDDGLEGKYHLWKDYKGFQTYTMKFIANPKETNFLQICCKGPNQETEACIKQEMGVKCLGKAE